MVGCEACARLGIVGTDHANYIHTMAGEGSAERQLHLLFDQLFDEHIAVRQSIEGSSDKTLVHWAEGRPFSAPRPARAEGPAVCVHGRSDPHEYEVGRREVICIPGLRQSRPDLFPNGPQPVQRTLP